VIVRCPWLAIALPEELWLLMEEGEEPFEVPSIYDERDFPEPPICSAGYGGGD
jgi:hypothetical protein